MLPMVTSSCPLPIRSQNSFEPQTRQKPRRMPGEDSNQARLRSPLIL
jgi:hypothetical protein